jgi:hypothetical protein
VAVLLEFVNDIVRKAAVESRFPGSLDGFARQELANLTEDDHLLRVGFMSTNDALRFVSELELAGLRYCEADASGDIAVLDGISDVVPAWLSLGDVCGTPACWDANHPAGELATPEPGFLLQSSRSVFDSLPEIAKLCGATLSDAPLSDAACIATLRCIRGDAEIVIDVIGDDSRVGLWGRRLLERRSQFRADAALIRDLVAKLREAGANE